MQKVLQLSSTIFYILKLLHDTFIINPISYICFNVHSQAIIHPLISHLIYLFKICEDLNELFLRFKISKF